MELCFCVVLWVERVELLTRELELLAGSFVVVVILFHCCEHVKTTKFCVMTLNTASTIDCLSTLQKYKN